MEAGGTSSSSIRASLDRVAMTVVDGTGSRADSLSGRMAHDSLHVERARRLSVLRRGPVGRYGWLAHDLLRNALLWTAGHGRDWPQRLAAGAPLMAPTRTRPGGCTASIGRHRTARVPAW